MNNPTPNEPNKDMLNSEVIPVEPIGATPIEISSDPSTEDQGTQPTDTRALATVPEEDAGQSTLLEKIRQYIEENRQQALIIGGGIIIFLIALLLISIIIGGGRKHPTTSTPQSQATPPGQAGGGGQTEVVIWGLWYDEEAMQPIIQEYQGQNPGVTITYLKQNFEHTDESLAYTGTYLTRVREQLMTEGVVDIVEIHHSWLPSLYKYLAPAPNDIGENLGAALFPSILKAATINGNLYTVPLFVDTLVLFYNKDLIDLSMVQPPYTWDEFNDRIEQVKKFGIPLGTFSNIYHAPEILLMLTVQGQGTIMRNGRFAITGTENQSALRFYTDYYAGQSVWSPAHPSDLKAFAKCSIPVVFAPSWRYINFINSNPDLKIGVLPPPIIGGAPEEVPQYIGSFWGFAVSKRSDVAPEAWRFLEWLNRPENLRRIYQYQVQTMKAGQPYARQDLAQEQTDQYAQTVHSMLAKTTFLRIYDYGLWEQGVKSILVDLDKNPDNVNLKLEELQQYLNGRLSSYQ